VSVDLRRFDDTKVGRRAGGHNPVFGVVGIPTELIRSSLQLKFSLIIKIF
jgi:hypothetical protein